MDGSGWERCDELREEIKRLNHEKDVIIESFVVFGYNILQLRRILDVVEKNGGIDRVEHQLFRMAGLDK